MKKLVLALAVVALCVSLIACSAEIPDLDGEWKQSNSSSASSYQEATIQDGVIEIYWVNEDSDTRSLYWAGSYKAPTEAGNEYSWESVNDKKKTDSALLASGDDTKKFTYKSGELSYSVSALGTTQTVKLKKN